MAISCSMVPCGTMDMPASISTARFTVSMLSNSITCCTSTLCSLKILSSALRVGMSGSKPMNFWPESALELDALVFGQRMLRMADQHQRVLAQRDDFQFAVRVRISHQPQVHHVAQHVFIDLVGAAIFHVHIDGGIALQKPLDVRRQIVQADAVNRRHADGAGNDVLDLLQLAVQRIISLDDLLAVLVQHLAFAGEPEFLFAALDQQGFELPFQGTDLLADGGLGHIVDLRGLGETLRFGQIAKTFRLSICIS